MTPVFCCGFECGQQGSVGQHWSISGTASFSTSTVRSGARSARINPTNNFGAWSSSTNWPTFTNKNVFRFYINFATLPNINCDILAFTGAGSTGGIVFKQSDSGLYLTNAASTATASGTAAAILTTGRWYRIDYYIDSSANPWSQKLSVDGGAEVTLSNAVAAVTPTGIILGDIFVSTLTMDCFFDDFIMSQTLADYPIGPGYINHFIPTSDGTHNVAGTGDFQRTLTGTDILNATTTAFQLIDDVPLESGTSVDWINMVAPPNATDYVECIFGPASGISTPTAGPRAVEVIAGIHQAGTGTGNMTIKINDNGTTDVMYTATTVAGTTTVIYKRKCYAANIANGGAWTVASGAGNFNNLRMRFGSPAAVDANPDQYLDCIMLEAEFATVVSGIPNKIYQISQAVNRSNTY